MSFATVAGDYSYPLGTGAGAVGVEFASIFHRFGCQVTVLEMLPRVVPVEDEEVSKELERAFKKQGIRVETGARVENVRRNRCQPSPF